MKKILYILILTSLSITAQKEKDSVNTEVVNIISSYKPTLSDAFKSKESPVIEKKLKNKTQLKYRIKSTPIKSVFKPSDGKFVATSRDYKKPLPKNYIKAGFGNYTTPLLESFVQKEKKEHRTTFYLYNKSSGNGGAKNVYLNNSYLVTNIDVNYKNTNKNRTWETGVAYDRNNVNWYGIPFKYDDAVLNNMNTKQIYNGLVLDAHLNLKKGAINNTLLQVDLFSDNYKSNESNFKFATQVAYSLYGRKINNLIQLDVLNGKFAQNYNGTEGIKYGFANIHLEGKENFKNNKLSFAAGLSIDLNNNTTIKSNKVYIFPRIDINYNLIEELLNIYGGIDGDLLLNSYSSITKENPFVSPTLLIQPSSVRKYFIGFKGKISSDISYDLVAAFIDEGNKLLFISNQNLTDGSVVTSQPYQAGNSFATVYDNVTNIQLKGQLAAKITKGIALGGTLAINNYTTSNQAAPWNLSPFEVTGFGNYSQGNFSTRLEIIARGNRKDLRTSSEGIQYNVENRGYLDLNLSSNYAFNKNWSAFLNFNNILNTSYMAYNAFPVQGFQIMAGGAYHFDF